MENRKTIKIVSEKGIWFFENNEVAGTPTKLTKLKKRKQKSLISGIKQAVSLHFLQLLKELKGNVNNFIFICLTNRRNGSVLQKPQTTKTQQG